MNMSSEKFEDLEEEYGSVFEDIKSRVDNKLPKLSGEQRKAAVRDVEKRLDNAKFLIDEMEEEAIKAPAAYRTQMNTKVRTMRKDIDKLRRDMERSSGTANTQLSFGREELFGGPSDPQAAQKNRLLQGTESLNRASESIARSQRVAAETEQVGVDIIDELSGQTGQLVRTRDRVKQTDESLGRSKRILKGMALRVATNKLILGLIILVELAILGAIVYIRFFKKKK